MTIASTAEIDRFAGLRSTFTPEFFIERLTRAWPELGRNWQASGRQEKTDSLKGWLQREGKGLGLCVYPDPSSPWHGEYIVDQLWGVEDGDVWGGIVLAVESELDPAASEILDDFDKLLDVRAVLKVLFCDPPASRREAVLKRLALQVGGHFAQVPEDRYLVIVPIGTGLRIWQINHLGRLSAAAVYDDLNAEISSNPGTERARGPEFASRQDAA